MKFVVYILKSKVDGSFYIGYTSNLERRLEEHNSGITRYTSKKAPWMIYFTEEYSDKSEALKREKFLKKQKNRQFYESLK